MVFRKQLKMHFLAQLLTFADTCRDSCNANMFLV